MSIRKPQVHHFVKWFEYGTLVQGAACQDVRAKKTDADIKKVNCKRCLARAAALLSKACHRLNQLSCNPPHVK